MRALSAGLVGMLGRPRRLHSAEAVRHPGPATGTPQAAFVALLAITLGSLVWLHLVVMRIKAARRWKCRNRLWRASRRKAPFLLGRAGRFSFDSQPFPRGKGEQNGGRILNQRTRKTVVVIGNGMVGQRFVEKLVEFDIDREFEIVTSAGTSAGLRPRAAHQVLRASHRVEARIVEPDWHENRAFNCMSAIARRPSTARTRSFAPPRVARSPTTTSCSPPAQRRSYPPYRASTRKACSSTARSRIWIASSLTGRR